MPSKSLPARPSLDQLKRQADELHRLHRDHKASAAARIVANHPRCKHMQPVDVFAGTFVLADAQLVIAREYGFDSWAALKHQVEAADRVAQFKPHPKFDDAVAAIDAGDVERLRVLLQSAPDLVHARTNLDPPYGYFTGATLLHHIAWNPGRPASVPKNVTDIARLLLERGADANALTVGRNAGTIMGLIATSKQASDANASGPLIELLLQHGAKLDLDSSRRLSPDWGESNVLHVALSNYATRAAEKLIELGAQPDVCVAAALGRMDLLQSFFAPDGMLNAVPRRHGKLLSERDAIGLALLFAYVNHHSEAVDFLLEKDGNWNMIGVNNGTALHRASWSGDLAMVQRLVAKGADISNRDNPFNSTPLSWAQHNRQTEVFDWLRTHTVVDLHDAVGMNLHEQVEARLREDPAAVNRQIDHWEVPRSTPLYWAAWNRISDVSGVHVWPEEERVELVRLLLDSGADPNIVAGDGYAALDVAKAAGAERVASLLQERGGREAEDL